MRRGEKLYSAEVHAILKLNEERYSVTKVAKLINKSRQATMNLLKDSDNCGESKSCERSRRLRARKRVASNSSSIARRIVEKAEVLTNVRNV